MNITDITRLNAENDFHCWQFTKDGTRGIYYSLDNTHLTAQMLYRQKIYGESTWVYENGVKLGEIRAFMPLDAQCPLAGIQKFYKLLMLQQ